MPVCADCGVDKGKAQFAPSQRQRAAAKMQYPPRAETPDEAVRRWQAERRRRRHSHEPDSTLSMISEPTLITGDVSPGSKTPEQALEEHRRSRSIRGRSLSFDLPKVSEGGRLRTRPPARRTCLPTPIIPPLPPLRPAAGCQSLSSLCRPLAACAALVLPGLTVSRPPAVPTTVPACLPTICLCLTTSTWTRFAALRAQRALDRAGRHRAGGLGRGGAGSPPSRATALALALQGY